jgi:hypothetical protein
LEIPETMMSFMCRLRACWFALVIVLSSNTLAVASDAAFPFDHELMLDVAPMRGSKRIPIIEIAESGAASIQLWCTSARAQANVRAGSITIVPGEIQSAQCVPERQSGDDNLMAALTQVTSWRRQGDVIELLGTTTLRFRLMTN